MRRILSFDIGIKNLAFCVVEISAPPSPVTLHRVVDWGVVNLISEVANSSQCERPECGNRPNQCLGRGTSKLLFCKNKKCGEWATQTWFTKHPKSKAKIAKYTNKKATSFSLVRMAEFMKAWLEKQQETWGDMEIHHCLLEHQPVFRNPVMKSVEMILVGILVGTGFTTRIEFVHAKKKTSEQSTYGDRKRVSVEAIEEMMKTGGDAFSEPIRSIWQESRKRDDLADTVNQALAWADTHT